MEVWRRSKQWGCCQSCHRYPMPIHLLSAMYIRITSSWAHLHWQEPPRRVQQSGFCEQPQVCVYVLVSTNRVQIMLNHLCKLVVSKQAGNAAGPSNTGYYSVFTLLLFFWSLYCSTLSTPLLKLFSCPIAFWACLVYCLSTAPCSTSEPLAFGKTKNIANNAILDCWRAM